MEEKSMVEAMLERARAAQVVLESYTQSQVDTLVRAMGKVIYDNAEILAEEAVRETGYGR